jgi:hypothetical protein
MYRPRVSIHMENLSCKVKAPDVQESVVMSSLHLNNNDMGRLQASPCEKLYCTCLLRACDWLSGMRVTKAIWLANGAKIS